MDMVSVLEMNELNAYVIKPYSYSRQTLLDEVYGDQCQHST